jgi:hypothetical protein
MSNNNNIEDDEYILVKNFNREDRFWVKFSLHPELPPTFRLTSAPLIDVNHDPESICWKYLNILKLAYHP